MSTEPVNPFTARLKSGNELGPTRTISPAPKMEIIQAPPSKIAIETNHGLRLTTLDEVREVAELFWTAGFYPAGFRNAQQIMLVLIRAVELGVPPGQAMEEAFVIGNRVSFKGTTLLALVKQSGLMVGDVKKEYTGEGANLSCTVTVQRVDCEPSSETFSLADAKTAELSNPNWKKYPRRMVFFRALGFLLRDTFPDVIRGMVSSEELIDYDRAEHKNVSEV